MKLAVVFIVQSRTLTTEMEETGFFLVSLGTLKKRGKSHHLGPTESNKSQLQMIFSVCGQILYKTHFQENCDQNFNLQFCRFRFLPGKNPSTLLVASHSLNRIKGNFVLCVFFCHLQLHFLLTHSIYFSLRVILFLFLKSSLFSLKAEHRL